MANEIVYDDEPRTVQYDEPPPPQTWGDTLRNVREGFSASGTGVARGIPILGPALTRGVNAIAAAPAALRTRTLSDLVTGRPTGAGEMYEKMQAEDERIRAEHPIAAKAGEVAGSLTTVPAARAFPKAFGGATLPGQMAAGGAIGGTDAAIRSGGDPTQIKWGAGIGAAAPVAGSLLAPLGQAAASAGRFINERLPAGSIFAKRVAPVATEQIERAADQGYKSLGGIANYNSQAFDDLSSGIKQHLFQQKARSGKVGAVETHEILDTLNSLPKNPAALHTIRKKLGNVKGDTDEMESAQFARRAIDQFLEAPPAHLLIGSTPQQAARAAQVLKSANADWKAFKSSSELRDRVAKGMEDAKTSINPVPFLAEGQGTRKQVSQLLQNKRASRFLQGNEKEALKDVTGGSLGERSLRLISGLSGTSRPSLFTAGSPVLAGMIGGWPAAAVATGAGIGSAAASSALTRRAINRADEVIRANAPYSQWRMAQQAQPSTIMSPKPGHAPAPYKPSEARDAVTRMLMLQAEREKTQPAPRRLYMDMSD